MDVAVIEKEALKLPDDVRALLADRLIQSVSPISTEQKNAWVAEADDRMDAFEKGLISAVDGPEALERVRVQFLR